MLLQHTNLSIPYFIFAWEKDPGTNFSANKIQKVFLLTHKACVSAAAQKKNIQDPYMVVSVPCLNLNLCPGRVWQ